jgi:hypothetical protein
MQQDTTPGEHSFFPRSKQTHIRLGEWTYNPQEDITPFELANIVGIFLTAVTPSNQAYDWKYIVYDKQVERHFHREYRTQ